MLSNQLTMLSCLQLGHDVHQVEYLTDTEVFAFLQNDEAIGKYLLTRFDSQSGQLFDTQVGFDDQRLLQSKSSPN